MGNTIRIRRSTGSAAPSSLANAELAFAEGTGALYIGVGTGGANGTATTIPQIASTTLFASQNAGLVYASPSGTSGAPSFRALAISDVTNLQSSLDAKAALAGATFTGGVTFSSTVALGSNATATTPATNDDSTRVATTAWVRAQNYGASNASGTVTSVALSLPGIFTVSGSPVTTTGTLTGTLANQNANIVFAGPTTGAAAAPTFRSLVASDIPDLSSTYLTVSTASSTYLTQSAASSTYLTQSTASSTYAPLASPALSGVPTSPTAAAGTNTTQIATTAYVTTAISNLVNGAGSALDTLKELADALGNDASFSTTIATSIGTKLTKSSNLSDLTDASAARTNLGLGTIATQAANNVNITGGTITGITIDGGTY